MDFVNLTLHLISSYKISQQRFCLATVVQLVLITDNPETEDAVDAVLYYTP